MNNLSKKSIAIIRALDLRIVQAEHATHFRKFKSFFVSNENEEIENFLEKKNATCVKLKLAHSYLFDPVRLLFGGTSHQSWLIFDNRSLENTLRPIDFYQIQEPFFPYSGQIAGMAEKFNKPLIMAPWMCFNHASTYIPPYSLSVKKAIDQTDLYIMRTKRVNNYLSRFKIPDRKKVLIYHGVNLKRFFPIEKKDDGKIKILFVGILDSSKGLDDILDIFPKLIKETKKRVELVICGKGNLEGKVRDMAKTLPINYLGQVSNLTLPSIYRNADIFCGPSKNKYFLGIMIWEENFGFVFVEAMACGLPIVANDCGAIKEVVGEDNYVNEQGNKEALLKSLLELINDKNIRRKIGIRNRKRAESYFDMEKQIIEEEKEISKRFIE
ncbi:MAG: glycosyltransferase family 4 protein [bacterium]|nr:glycosyltransferase family 4 protein [bacterium]